jgi:hypothetical protein
MSYSKGNTITVEEIKKVEITDNTILAIGLPKNSSPDQARALQEQLLSALGHEKASKILIYIGGLKLNTVEFKDGKLEVGNLINE